MTWRPDGTVQDPHGVLGGQVVAPLAPDVAAIQQAELKLRAMLLASLPASSFKVWFAPMNAFHWQDLALFVAAAPESERAPELIEALPDTLDGFDIYRVEFPEQPAIGD
jgi:hypothetical protein